MQTFNILQSRQNAYSHHLKGSYRCLRIYHRIHRRDRRIGRYLDRRILDHHDCRILDVHSNLGRQSCRDCSGWGSGRRRWGNRRREDCRGGCRSSSTYNIIFDPLIRRRGREGEKGETENPLPFWIGILRTQIAQFILSCTANNAILHADIRELIFVAFVAELTTEVTLKFKIRSNSRNSFALHPSILYILPRGFIYKRRHKREGIGQKRYYQLILISIPILLDLHTTRGRSSVSYIVYE